MDKQWKTRLYYKRGHFIKPQNPHVESFVKKDQKGRRKFKLSRFFNHLLPLFFRLFLGLRLVAVPIFPSLPFPVGHQGAQVVAPGRRDGVHAKDLVNVPESYLPQSRLGIGCDVFSLLDRKVLCGVSWLPLARVQKSCERNPDLGNVNNKQL